MVMAANAPCPCGGGTFSSCCKDFLAGERKPEHAEALMRSRFTAYALGDEAYLRATWYASSRPDYPFLADQSQIKWLNLRIVRHEVDGQWATVEFIARYKVNGRAQKLHEISRFVCEDNRWYYLDGEFPAT